MMKKGVIILFIMMGFFLVAKAQEDGKMVLTGTVVDSQTNEPVAFANLGLLGTVAGVASDMDGNFELRIPDKYAIHVVRVSAVGYASVEYKAYELRDKPGMVIKLRPVSYGIGEVDVYGQLLVYKKMLSNVVSHIHDNYISKPYNYEGYFKYVTDGPEGEKMKEATVTVYDAKGYDRTDPETTFKEVNYKFNEVRRSTPQISVFDGLTCLDDILTADVVRNTRNVLDIVNSRDYKLKSKGRMLYEGDSVQVISYTLEKPSLSTTGTSSVTAYSGEIYINLRDFAVLKNVVNISSRDFNSLGRQLVAIGEKSKADVTTQIVTTYKKLKSVYFLSGVTINYSYEEEGEEVRGDMEFVTTRVNMDAPEAIEGRTYYENIVENEAFWNSYTTYFEE